MKRYSSFLSLIGTLFIGIPSESFTQGWVPVNPTFRGVYALDTASIITVGEFGRILKSTDGGISWEPRQSGLAVALNDVAMGDSIGVAVGDEGTILQTTDFGETWIHVSSGILTPLLGLAYAESGTFVAVGSFGVILRSVDGGFTWTGATSGTTLSLHGISFATPTTGVAFGELGTLLRTTDGGISWGIQSIASETLRACAFVDSSRGLLVGNAGMVAQTSDGGLTWTFETSSLSASLRDVGFVDDSIVVVVGGDIHNDIPGPPIVLRSTNGGAAWTEIPQQGVTTYLEAISFGSRNGGIAVGTTGGILQIGDAGEEWTRRGGGINPPNNNLFSVSFLNAGTGYVGGDYYAFKTTDGGQLWDRNYGVLGSLLDIVAVDPGSAYCAGFEGGGGIFRTTIESSNWSLVLGGYASGVSFIDESTGWITGTFYGTIYHTTDGGETWTLQYDNGSTFSLEGISFTNSMIGTAVGGWINYGRILRTTDGGVTWTIQSGATSWLKDVSFTDVNTGTCVGDDGVIFRTTDGGTNWISQASGTSASLVGVCFVDANVGTIVGREGNILRTTDGGQLWQAQTSGTAEQLLDIDFSDANVGTAVGLNGLLLRTSTGGTGVEPPVATTLVSPLNGSAATSSPLLTWNSAPDVLWYTLQVGLDPYFRTVVLNQTNITGTSYQLADLIEGETYFWRISLTDPAGSSGWSETWAFSVVVTDAGEVQNILSVFRLDQNYPNPFNPVTNFGFEISDFGFVSLRIFDLLGREVATVVNEKLAPGSYSRQWDARGWPSGMYFYRLQAGSYTETKKLLLLR